MFQPVRKPVLPRGRRRVVGYFTSLKSESILPWESQIERDHLYLLEVDPTVRCVSVQPAKIEYKDGSRLRTYVPDVYVKRQNCRQFIEVKTDRDAACEENVHRYQLIAQLLENKGIEFRLVLESQIRRQPYLDNAKLIMSYLPHRSFNFDENRCLELLANSSKPTLKDVSVAISGKASLAIALTLVAAGYFSLDLSKEISMESCVNAG